MSAPDAPSSEPQAIPLSQLPLVDHESGAYGGLDSAVIEYRHRLYQERTRDEAARRQAELEREFQRGVEQGEAQATQRARQEGLDLLRTFPSLVNMASAAAGDAARAAVAEASRDMVAAAVEIAQWILADALEVDSTRLLRIAEAALRDAGGLHGSVVYVSEDLYSSAQHWAQALGAQAPDVVVDRALGQASVRVVAATGGRADISLATLVARAAEALGVSQDPASENS